MRREDFHTGAMFEIHPFSFLIKCKKRTVKRAVSLCKLMLVFSLLIFTSRFVDQSHGVLFVEIYICACDKVAFFPSTHVLRPCRRDQRTYQRAICATMSCQVACDMLCCAVYMYSRETYKMSLFLTDSQPAAFLVVLSMYFNFCSSQSQHSCEKLKVLIVKKGMLCFILPLN